MPRVGLLVAALLVRARCSGPRLHHRDERHHRVLTPAHTNDGESLGLTKTKRGTPRIGCQIPLGCGSGISSSGPDRCTDGVAVVHAGFAKTATSYIQSTLWQNRVLLKSQDILYPGSAPKGFGHHFLPEYLSNASNFVRRSHPDSSSASADSDAQECSRSGDSYGLLVQQLVTEVDCVPCSTRALISSEHFSTLRSTSMERIHHVLQPRRIHVLLFYRNMKDFIVSMYCQNLRNAILGSSSGSAYPVEQLGQTGSLKEYLLIHNAKENKWDRFGKLGTWFINKVRGFTEAFNVTIIDYAGAVKRGDPTDALLKAAGLPTLDIAEHPGRAGVRDSAPTSLGDETVRQLFPYLYDYARKNRSAELVSGKIYDLDFNKLTIANYGRPTEVVDLSDLVPQAHALDETLRRLYGRYFSGEFSDQTSTKHAINSGTKTFEDLNHTAMKRELQHWHGPFTEQLDKLPSEFQLTAMKVKTGATTSLKERKKRSEFGDDLY